MSYCSTMLYITEGLYLECFIFMEQVGRDCTYEVNVQNEMYGRCLWKPTHGKWWKLKGMIFIFDGWYYTG